MKYMKLTTHSQKEWVDELKWRKLTTEIRSGKRQERETLPMHCSLQKSVTEKPLHTCTVLLCTQINNTRKELFHFKSYTNQWSSFKLLGTARSLWKWTFWGQHHFSFSVHASLKMPIFREVLQSKPLWWLTGYTWIWHMDINGKCPAY